MAWTETKLRKVCGLMTKVSESTGIPETTLKNKTDWWDDLVVSVRSEIRALAEQCKELSRTMRDHGIVSVQKHSAVPEESNG